MWKSEIEISNETAAKNWCGITYNNNYYYYHIWLGTYTQFINNTLYSITTNGTLLYRHARTLLLLPFDVRETGSEDFSSQYNIQR